MAATFPQQGDRKVQPGQQTKRGSAGRGAKARRAERRAAQRALEAQQLVQAIEATTADRHEAWSEGDQPFATERLTSDLDRLHQDKRTMRRDIYRVAPDLEGRPVFKGQPGGRS